MKRRDFLKVSLYGSASAFLALNSPAAAAEQKPALVYRTLGRTGLKVTAVSFGAMLTPEPEVIRAGFEQGINYVDTARRYLGGRSEEIVATALQGMRDKVYIATKSTGKTQKDVLSDAETSLSSLKTDHIDVYQLHNLTNRDRIYDPEIREALTRLRKDGKVRFFGVTTHTNQADVLNGLAEDPDRFFDTALVAYNFKSGDDVKRAIDACARKGIGIIAMKTQAGGYKADALGGISPHQAALKWVLQDRNVSTTIPGMRDLAQVKEMMGVMGMNLQVADRFLLRWYGAAIEPFYCRHCGTCEAGCPRGVEISTVNRSLMYAEAYRDPALARETYSEIPRRSSASACLSCGGCTARCANGLDIAAKMEQARTLFRG